MAAPAPAAPHDERRILKRWRHNTTSARSTLSLGARLGEDHSGHSHRSSVGRFACHANAATTWGSGGSVASTNIAGATSQPQSHAAADAAGADSAAVFGPNAHTYTRCCGRTAVLPAAILTGG